MSESLRTLVCTYALIGYMSVSSTALGYVGVDDPCPLPTPYPPAGAGWATTNNPDMEDGFTNNVANDWVGWKDSTYTGIVHYVGTDRSYTGNYSQKLVMPQPAFDYQEAGIYQQIYVIPGETYTVTARFYLRFPVQTYNGEDLLGFLGVDPFGQASGDGYGMIWDETATQNQWVQTSVTVEAVFPVMTISLKGTRKWPWHGDGAEIWFDAVTVTGPVPTELPPGPEPDPIDPETLIPATMGPNLVTNGTFEGSFSNGVSADWLKWSTAGSGTWRRSQRVGKVGPGRYDCGPLDEVAYMKPKTVLLLGGNPEDNPNNTAAMGDAYTLATDPRYAEMFQDTIFVGRPFIDGNLDDYFNTETPAYWGRRFAEQCKHFEQLVPRIDCWQGLNEPGTGSFENYQEVLEWEYAFAQRCHELGLKSCSLNLSTGSPGNIWRMVDERFSPSTHDLLDIADYLGYHSYGGPNDQLMVDNQDRDNACAFALRPRRFKDMYDRRDWRFPPVIATEGSTYGGWHGQFSGPQIADDHELMGQYMNADQWWCGYTNFACGIQCNPAWIPWDIVNIYGNNGQLISEEIGNWNYNNPADKMDGLYSQMFGAGHVHPINTSQLTPDGDFNGGITQQIAGLTPGEAYLAICWMKYEFRGYQPDQLAFYLGIDHTGQTSNGNATSIDWGSDQINDKAPVHEIFTHVWRTFVADSNTASLWVRAHQPVTNPSFMVYVDSIEVRQLDDAPAAPYIELWPQQLSASTSLGIDPPDASFNIRNGGTDTINYTISESCSWLSISPAQGSSSGDTQTIQVDYDVTGLSPGTYQCTLTVSSAEAVNSPLLAPVISLDVRSVKADFDLDGDVDQKDFGLLQTCFSGQGVFQGDPICEDTDLDGDNDVDSEDFSRFLGCMSGSDVNASPTCE